MLNQVVLPRALGASVHHDAADGMKLVIAREDQVLAACLPALVIFFLHIVNEVLDERKMSEATPEGQKRLPRVPIEAVLSDGVLDVLAGERILQLGGEEWQAVQEEDGVEAALVLLAVVKLSDDRENVAQVKSPQLLVQAADRPEVCEIEQTAGVLDTASNDVERASAGDFARESLQEPIVDVCPVVLFQLRPFLRLGRQDEGEGVAGDQTECAVVVLLRIAAIVPPGRAPTETVDGLADCAPAGGSIRSARKERRLDRRLEGSFGYVHLAPRAI